MASIIVAGATGAIGRTVVQHAIRQPGTHRVVALTRSANVAASNYDKLFGIVAAGNNVAADGTIAVTAEEAAKITAVTLDWEAFTAAWVAHRNSAAAPNMTPPPSEHPDHAAETVGAATSATEQTGSTPMAQYQQLFTGHTYAAMCLGTTRNDAGSSKKFVRCDYDYVIAFTEAVMTFSAPAGLAPASAFVRHIGDEGKGAYPGSDEPYGRVSNVLAAVNADAARSSRTLRVVCQVSASGADSGSWFLYMRTKGIADEAAVERVQQHNQFAAAAQTLSPVLCFVMQPGTLERGHKSRTNEKLAKLFLSSIPVDTCGAAIIAACTRATGGPSSPARTTTSTAAATTTPAAAQAAKAHDEEQELESKTAAGADEAGAGGTKPPLGKPYVPSKLLRRAGASSTEPLAHVYRVYNDVIRSLAESG